MRRFFVKNLAFVIIVNLLVKPIWVLLIDRNVQNTVGHANYGTYQALFNLGVIFNIILDFGLTFYNTRIISGDPKRLKDMFPAMLSARLLLIGLYTIVVGIAGLALGYGRWELILLAGILMIHAFSSLMQFFRSNVSALHKFKADALLSVADRLLMIIICGFLLYYPATREHFIIEWFILAQIICYGIALIIGFFVLRYIAKMPLVLSFRFADVSKIIKHSLPYATLVFMMAVHTRADTVLIERISGVESKDFAGIYASAYRLLDIGNMFGILFAGMLLPMFGRMLANNNNVQPIVKLSVNLLLPMSFMATGVAIFYGTEIMELLYVDANEYSGQVFAWLMACFPAYSIMYIYSTLLTANNNLILLNKIAFAGIIINLTLNFILIPKYQALGAAQVAFITQGTLAACYIIFSKQKLTLPYNKKWLAAHAIFIGSVLLIGWASTLLPFSWSLQLSAFVIVLLVLIFILKFISVDAVRSFMEKSKNS